MALGIVTPWRGFAPLGIVTPWIATSRSLLSWTWGSLGNVTPWGGLQSLEPSLWGL